VIRITLVGIGTGTLLSLHSFSSRTEEPVLMLVCVDRMYYVVRAVPLTDLPSDLPRYEHRGPAPAYYERYDAETAYEIDKQYMTTALYN
jgi:hypothetical protein